MAKKDEKTKKTGIEFLKHIINSPDFDKNQKLRAAIQLSGIEAKLPSGELAGDTGNLTIAEARQKTALEATKEFAGNLPPKHLQ